MRTSAALVAISLLFGAGCGGVHYAVVVTGASGRLAEAREMGAEQQAPFEYYYAKAHLEQAQVEAASAAYSDAARYAATADEYALKAIEATKTKQREGTE
ncbi:MAG: DUF4398 domain-containing protein [Myxococcales bacterium]|nr:DUF4398 domain-containing protein [Myxococcales bacterium]